MDKYKKIRKWLGYDYHLSVGVEPNKPDKWALYKRYNDRDVYFCNVNSPIMTSEKHTYKQLYNFAKKTHMVNILLLNCKVRLGIVTIALILATINLFIGNTILRVIIYTSNTIIITENLIHAIGLSKNEKALKTRITYEHREVKKKMTQEEFIKYTEKMNKSIAHLLKDNEEELAFYSQLVRSFNNVCEKNDRLGKKINELINDIEPLYSDDSAFFPISTYFKEKLLDELKEISK